MVQKGVSLLLFPFMLYYEANHYFINKNMIFKLYLQEKNKLKMETLKKAISTNTSNQKTISMNVFDFLDFRNIIKFRYITQYEFSGYDSFSDFYVNTIFGIKEFVQNKGITNMLMDVDFKRQRIYSNESLWDKFNNSFVLCDSFDFIIGSSLFILSRSLFKKGTRLYYKKFN